MALSEVYIMQRVRNFLDNEVGKTYVKNKAGVTLGGSGAGSIGMEEIQIILEDIKAKFIAAVTAVIASFRVDGVIATIDSVADSEERVRATISVDEDALRRESLYINSKGDQTGEGIDDILALFTHGYTLTGKRPYGYWVHSSQGGLGGITSAPRIGALVHRDANPFLSEFVDEINSEYGSKCVVTLNNRYV